MNFKSCGSIKNSTRSQDWNKDMFHKVKSVRPMDDFVLLVSFSEGVTKTYDVKPLFSKWLVFNELKNNHLFEEVSVDQGGYGVSWNDDIDLSCDELFYEGKEIKTPFDGLIAFTEACQLWNLNESTLRKAVSYGKLIDGIDVSKYGKQWVVTMKAMEREYGPLPVDKR